MKRLLLLPQTNVRLLLLPETNVRLLLLPQIDVVRRRRRVVTIGGLVMIGGLVIIGGLVGPGPGPGPGPGALPHLLYRKEYESISYNGKWIPYTIYVIGV